MKNFIREFITKKNYVFKPLVYTHNFYLKYLRNINSDLVNTFDCSYSFLASNYDLSKKSERLRSVKNLEKLFFRIIADISPDLFLEAGAKDARTSIRARRHLPNSRIIAFEANPYTFNRYSKVLNSKNLGIEYLHLALSNKQKFIDFNVPLVDGFPSTAGHGSILESDSASKVESVKAVRLDQFFSYSSFSSAAIWMDVEGATKQVLLGSENILYKVDALFIEVEDSKFWNGQWLAKDVFRMLYKYNFIPLARDFQSRYQYNIIFIKKDLYWRARIRYFFTMFASESRFHRPADDN